MNGGGEMGRVAAGGAAAGGAAAGAATEAGPEVAAAGALESTISPSDQKL